MNEIHHVIADCYVSWELGGELTAEEIALEK